MSNKIKEGVGTSAEGFEIMDQGETPTMVPDGSDTPPSTSESQQIKAMKDAVRNMRRQVYRLDKKPARSSDNDEDPRYLSNGDRTPKMAQVFKTKD